MLFPLCGSPLEGLAGYSFVVLHGWWSGDPLELFFFSFSLGTTSQNVTNDATNAHCTGWQASMAAKSSITKKKKILKHCPLVTSKHERVKVMERVWAHPGATVQVTGFTGQAERIERPLNHLTCIRSGLKKPFTWEEKLLKSEREEVQLPSSGVIKSKNGDYMMVLSASLACYFPHFSWSMFCSICLHFQHSDPLFSALSLAVVFLPLNSGWTAR